MAMVDIIVGVKNEEEHIERCIKSLQNQTISDIKILVVDGLSNDKTCEIVGNLMVKDPRIKLLTNQEEKISSGRNIGLKTAKSEYVAYLDGHTYVNENWLEILYKTLINCGKKEKIAGVGSTYDSPDDDTPFGRTVALCVGTVFGGLGTSFTIEENVHRVETVAFALYKRDILKKEGIIYDEDMTHCEDTDFNHQLVKKGYVLLKHPHARVYQYRRKNLEKFFVQMVNYGEGRCNLIKKYRETLKYYHLIPLVAIFYLISLLAILILFSITRINLQVLYIAFLPFILYLLLDVLFTIKIIWKNRKIESLNALLIFPIVHIGYGIGFIKGFI